MRAFTPPPFHYFMLWTSIPDSFVCIKVVGRQWYWHYEVTYDGFTHYDNITKFSQAKIFNDTLFKFKNYFNHIQSFNSASATNLIKYINLLYKQQYILQNKVGWLYKQNYTLHIKLFADLYKNLIFFTKNY